MANQSTGGLTVCYCTKCWSDSLRSTERTRKNCLLPSPITTCPIRRVWVRRPKMFARGWVCTGFPKSVNTDSECLLSVVDQEPAETLRLRSAWWGGCPGSCVLPPNRLGKDREPWSAATVQTKNRNVNHGLVVIKFMLHTSFHSQKHRKDVSNFDRQFTSEKTDLTPTDKLFMMNLDQTEFNGFSYLNPEFVQHI